MSAPLYPGGNDPRAGDGKPHPVTERTDAPRWWPTALTATACLAVFLALCRSVRPQADDFKTPLLTRHFGWWGAQGEFYRTWTGKFTATALGTALGIGDHLTFLCRCMTAAILVAFIAAMVFLGRALAPARPREATAVALALAAAYAGSAADNEGFFWASASVAYMTAAVGTMAGAGLAVRTARQRVAGLDMAGLITAGFLTAGCCETIIPLAGMAFAVGWWFQRRQKTAAAAWGTLGLGLCAGAIVLLCAPGNRVRLDHIHAVNAGTGADAITIATTAAGAAASAAAHAAWDMVSQPVTVACAVLIAPFAHGLGRPPGGWWTVAGLAGLGVGGIALAAMPAEAAIGYLEPHITDLLWWWLLGWSTMAWLSACALLAPLPGSSSTPLPNNGSAAVPTRTLAMLGLLACAGVSGIVGSSVWLAWILIALGVMAGLTNRARVWARAAVMAAFAVLVLHDAAPDLVIHAPLYRAVWERRDQALTEAHARGERLAVIPCLPDDAYPLDLVQTDIPGNPRCLSNQEKATWYGVDEIWLDFGLSGQDPLRKRWERQLRQRALALGQTTIGGKPLPDP